MKLSKNFEWLNQITWDEELKKFSDYDIIKTLSLVEYNIEKFYSADETTNEKITAQKAVFDFSRELFENLMYLLNDGLGYGYENVKNATVPKQIFKDFCERCRETYEGEEDKWDDIRRSGYSLYQIASGNIHSNKNGQNIYPSDVNLNIWRILDAFNKIFYELSVIYSNNNDKHIDLIPPDLFIYMPKKDEKYLEQIQELQNQIKTPANAINQSLYDFIIGAFLNKQNIIIPPYQRSYSWSEKQINTFIGDLMETYVEDEKIGNSCSPHYCGVILTNYISKFSPQHNKYTTCCRIVDGQQRIITAILLMLSIRDTVLRFHGFPKNTTKTGIKIIDSFFKDDWIVQVNLCEEQQLFALRDIYVGKYKEIDLLDNGTNLVLKNYFLLKFILNDTIETLAKENKIKFIENLTYCFKKYFIITNQFFNNNTSSIEELKIFDSINTKGKPLTISDRIKSFLFTVCGNDLNTDQNFDLINQKMNLAFSYDSLKQLYFKNEKSEIHNFQDKSDYEKIFIEFVDKLNRYIIGPDYYVKTHPYDMESAILVTTKRTSVDTIFEEFCEAVKKQFNINDRTKSYELCSRIVEWFNRYFLIFFFSKFGLMNFQRNAKSIFSYETFLLSLACHRSNSELEYQFIFLIFDFLKSNYDSFLNEHTLTPAHCKEIAKWFMLVCMCIRNDAFYNIDLNAFLNIKAKNKEKDVDIDLDDWRKSALSERAKYCCLANKFKNLALDNNHFDVDSLHKFLSNIIIGLNEFMPKSRFYNNLNSSRKKRPNSNDKNFALWCLTINLNDYNPVANTVYWEEFYILPKRVPRKSEWFKNIKIWNNISNIDDEELEEKIYYSSNYIGNMCFIPLNDEPNAKMIMSHQSLDTKIQLAAKAVIKHSNIKTTFNSTAIPKLDVSSKKDWTFKDIKERNKAIVDEIQCLENRLQDFFKK